MNYEKVLKLVVILLIVESLALCHKDRRTLGLIPNDSILKTREID